MFPPSPLGHTYTEEVHKQISHSKRKRADSVSCTSATLLLVPLQARMCRGCEWSYKQAAIRKCEKSLPRRMAALVNMACQEISIHGSNEQRPSSFSPGESRGCESSCTWSALMYPVGTDPASLPSTKLCFFVSWTTKKHLSFSDTTKNSVCSNTNTGSASVLQNQIKALKAANYAMEYLKNPWKHGSSFLKCPHAGVWVRNGCFKLQYIEGAIPSNQFNFRPKYKNIPSPPGELN